MSATFTEKPVSAFLLSHREKMLLLDFVCALTLRDRAGSRKQCNESMGRVVPDHVVRCDAF